MGLACCYLPLIQGVEVERLTVQDEVSRCTKHWKLEELRHFDALGGRKRSLLAHLD